MNAATEATAEALRHLLRETPEIWAGSTEAEVRGASRGVLVVIREALRESPVEIADALGLEQVGWRLSNGVLASSVTSHHSEDRPVFAVLPVEENGD